MATSHWIVNPLCARSHDVPLAQARREVSSAGEAIELATALVAFPVADLDHLEPGVAYRLSVRADLNPISQELLADVRRWLARLSPRSRMGSGDNSFFGSS